MLLDRSHVLKCNGELCWVFSRLSLEKEHISISATLFEAKL